MPPADRPIDLSRPRCRSLAAQRRRYVEEHGLWLRRLRATSNSEERERILRTLEHLEFQVQDVEDQLTEQGCYEPSPVPHSLFIKVDGMEVTQAIQFHRQLGSGFGAENSIPLVAAKATLCRVYVDNRFSQDMRVTGRVLVMAWNRNSLKYDIFRRELAPQNERASIFLSAETTSDRRRLDNTLNFLLAAVHCNERLRLDAEVWAEDHHGDPAYTGKHSQEIVFNTRERPVIHSFRFNLTGLSPAVAEPSDANCRTTMELAPRILPVSSLEIRERGVRVFRGSLASNNDYDQIRIVVQTIRDGTTPTPPDHEIYVAMVPAHTAAAGVTALGAATNSTLWCLVNQPDTFAHELAHLILPGDDHVLDSACGTPEQVDTHYPNYPNTTTQSGIGEFGVDLGRSPMVLHGPDTSDLMSYCRPRWISPYNYSRAFTSAVLNPFDVRVARSEGAQKLLVRFRVYREGTAELKWAFHLPGEAPPRLAKYKTGLTLELYRTDGSLVVSQRCHPGSDHSASAPYTDFLETVPWFDDVARVVLTQEGNVVADWTVDDTSSELAAEDLSASPSARAGNEGGMRVTWKRVRTGTHQMLRYSPDGGTWIPLAVGIEGDEIEVPADCLRGASGGRFQLATSSGFRTTLVVTSEPRAGPDAVREVQILRPARDSVLVRGEALRLSGRTMKWLDGRRDDHHAYWTSSRDGFLADELNSVIDGLSLGRHVLRLVVDDGTTEISDRVIITVKDRG